MNDNVRKMQSLYEAFGRGDIATILASLTDDISWGTDTLASEIPWYRLRKGPAGVGEFFETLAREVDFDQFTPRLFVGSDDGSEVIVSVDMVYRFKKNGRSANMTSVHCFRMRDGKVTRFRGYEDTAGVREAWSA